MSQGFEIAKNWLAECDPSLLLCRQVVDGVVVERRAVVLDAHMPLTAIDLTVRWEDEGLSTSVSLDVFSHWDIFEAETGLIFLATVRYRPSHDDLPGVFFYLLS